MSSSSTPSRRIPGSRRVVTAAPAGSDPNPQAGAAAIRAAEDNDGSWGGVAAPSGNEKQLREDVPPHWGTHTH